MKKSETELNAQKLLDECRHEFDRLDKLECQASEEKDFTRCDELLEEMRNLVERMKPLKELVAAEEQRAKEDQQKQKDKQKQDQQQETEQPKHGRLGYGITYESEGGFIFYAPK